jgi:hypothetical protein
MDAIDAADLHRLLQNQLGFATTIYMPTHVVGPNAPDDTLRLKNLVSTAKHKLIEYGRRPADVRESLKVIHDLPHDAEFWDRRSKGLAIFLSDSSFERFRLGTPVDEAVIVNRRFHVKQLLPSVVADGRFFILAASQNHVRLLQATRYACASIPVQGLPVNLDETLNLVGAERGQQVHSAMHGSLGKQAAVFHGQGGERETAKDEIVQFFRAVDAALRPVLRESQAPLILAMVEYEAPLFRDVCAYPHLAEEIVAGNFDYDSEHDLHGQALPIAERVFGRQREEAGARYCELAQTKRASDRLDAILPAAIEGRVETLFLDYHAVELGAFDPATRFISYGCRPGGGCGDLLDRVAVESLLRHGHVYAVDRAEMPCKGPVAAIFRY